MPKNTKKQTKRGKKKGVNKKMEKAVLEIVRAENHKQAETKQAYHSINGSSSAMTYFNSGITSSGDMLQVLPYISQGSGDNQRIGDQINTQSLKISGYIRYLPNTENYEQSAFSHVVARLMVVSLKYRSAYPDSAGSTAPLSGLLKKGGTATAFTGVLSDIFAPINTDLWTKHHNEVFYLSQPLLVQPGTAGQTTMPLDVKNLVKFFNINIPCKKTLKYDNNVTSGSSATNFAPMLLLGYAYLNGDAPDTVTSNLGMYYTSILNYEDA